MHVVNYAGMAIRFTGEYSGSYSCITQGRFYEQALLDHVRDLHLQGTYLDIGTNIGNHALFFALLCPSYRVIGFEPMPHWRARALDNLAINGCNSKVDIRPVGLLQDSGILEFRPYATTYLLACSTLDLELPDVDDVAFVKMDIEGSEPKALLGGKEFFRRNRPLIFSECLGDTRELASAAEAINYRIKRRLPIAGISPMYELRPRRD